jgi:hypothetical protein
MGAAGVPLIGGLMQAGGALMEADDRAKGLRAEADAADKNARNALSDAAYNAERQEMIAGQRFAEIKTGYAASGISSTSVSAIEVLRASHINAEMDRLNILHGGRMEAEGFKDRASAARAGAKRAKKIGEINAFSSLFGAGANAAMMSDGGESNSRASSREGYGSAGGSGGNYGGYA